MKGYSRIGARRAVELLRKMGLDDGRIAKAINARKPGVKWSRKAKQ